MLGTCMPFHKLNLAILKILLFSLFMATKLIYVVYHYSRADMVKIHNLDEQDEYQIYPLEQPAH